MTKQKKHHDITPPPSPLEVAVAATPDVKGHFQKSLQALESKDKERSLIDYADPTIIKGSVYLEHATKNLEHPYPKRWDYVIEYDDKIYYYEPHPASGGKHIAEVCGKADWLLWWLKNNATDIKNLGTEGFYWIHTGECAIDKNSKQYKTLVDKGVQLKSRLYMK